MPACALRCGEVGASLPVAPLRPAAWLIAAVACSVPAIARAFPVESPSAPATTDGGGTEAGTAANGAANGTGNGGEAAAVPTPEGATHQITPQAGGGLPSGPGWTIQPRVDIQEIFNDNIFATQTDRRYDFETVIAPGISIGADTRRLQARLEYDPTAEIYARTSSENNVGQNVAATGLLTIVPDELFLDARAYATQQVLNGGVSPNQNNFFTTGRSGPTSNLFINNNQLTQTYSYSLSPYVTHRFGDTGTLQAGVSYSQTIFGSGATIPSNSVFGSQALAGTTQTSTEEYAKFTTGPRFGRILNQALFDSTQQTGTGGSGDFHHTLGIDEIDYAFTREIAGIVDFGGEDLSFAGTPPIHITDVVWDVGARLTPNPDSTITVRYGHHEGINSFFLDATYAVTARTTIYANYSEGLSTDTGEIVNNLDQAAINPYGQTINAETGAPLLINNGFFGLTGNLYRQKSLSLTSTTALDRDSISLSVMYQNQKEVSAVPGSPSGSTDGTIGTVSWQHQLTPVTFGTVYADYGIRSFSGTPSETQNLFDASAAVTHIFTESLTGIAQYTFTNSHSNLPGNSYFQNVFLVGLHKAF